MVEFDLAAALVGGFVATVVMSAVMAMATAAGMTRMPPMPLVTGAMLFGDRRRAMAMGTVVHFVVMGTVVFGIGYAVVFNALDSDSWLAGLLVGVGHGVAVGAVFMPMMPAMHPRMARAPVAVIGGTGTDSDEVQLTAPGPFGVNWGAMTPMGLVAGHALYGLVLALVYAWVA
ncbi:MAG: DUF6789 family protein [Acidimicrobiales bacterium]